MGPLDYTTDVLNPIEGYMQGLKFGEGILTDRLNRDATTQNMGIQRETMDLAQAQFAAQERARAQQRADAQAQAAAAQAQADALKATLMSAYDGIESGDLTPGQILRISAENPEIAAELQAGLSFFGEERAAVEADRAKQFIFALNQGKPEVVRSELQVLQEAAEAAGDKQGSDTYKGLIMSLDADPTAFQLQQLLALSALIPNDEFEQYTSIIGFGGDEAKPNSAIAKLQADLDAGLINQAQYDLGVANLAPPGMKIVSDGAGGFTFEQGTGVNGGDDGGLQPASPQAMVDSIDGILNDPALDLATGWLAWTQNIPGTEARRFGARARQLEGQAFLQAFDSLKGAGQITEIEGTKATQAIGRLDTAQRPEDYRAAVTELRDLLKLGIERGKAAQGGVPEGIPADVWEVMTPDEKALFQ